MTAIPKSITDGAGALVKAEEFIDAALGAPVAVTLTFKRGIFTVRVRPEDDTVELVRGTKKFVGCRRKKSALFASVIGKEAVWVRTLTNQQGYPDGIQFEFWSAGDRRSNFVQHIAAGSALRGLCWAG